MTLSVHDVLALKSFHDVLALNTMVLDNKTAATTTDRFVLHYSLYSDRRSKYRCYNVTIQNKYC